MTAAVTIAMLAMVATTVAATRLPRRTGLALTAAAGAVCLAVVAGGGGDVAGTVKVLPPLLLIAGYAALADVLVRCGTADVAATRLPKSPVWVMLFAAVAAAVLSNDVVVVAFAPVVLRRRTRVVDAAAVFVGANVTGGLLPQGSPTNLLLLGNHSFAEYLQLSWPVTAAMLAAAVAGLAAWSLVPALSSRLPVASHVDPVHDPLAPRPEFTGVHRMLLVVVAAAVAAQPLSDLAGVSRPVLGAGLLVTAVVVCLVLRMGPAPTLVRVPWQLAPVVMVLAAGATVLSATSQQGVVGPRMGLLTFLVSSTGTDILAAALAAPVVAAGALGGAAALVSVTAGAFTTPVSSVAAVLLIDEHQQAKVRMSPWTFVVAGSTAVVCWAAGTAVALLVAA